MIWRDLWLIPDLKEYPFFHFFKLFSNEYLSLIIHLYFIIMENWQEYTELYKKDFNDTDNHGGVITHLEPDILECEVKRARKHHYEQS